MADSIPPVDIYQPYINPHATEKQILCENYCLLSFGLVLTSSFPVVDSLAIGGYGVFLGVLGVIFFYLNISLGWLYSFTGMSFSSVR